MFKQFNFDCLQRYDEHTTTRGGNVFLTNILNIFDFQASWYSNFARSACHFSCRSYRYFHVGHFYTRLIKFVPRGDSWTYLWLIVTMNAEKKKIDSDENVKFPSSSSKGVSVLIHSGPFDRYIGFVFVDEIRWNEFPV